MWNKVITGFDVENETANFGTRACAESDVVVYETNTLATVHANEKGPQKDVPSVLSEISSQQNIVIAIDKSVVVFKENCSSVLFNEVFEHNVEYAVISPDGTFILVGLSNCDLKCIHVDSNYLVFSKNFPVGLKRDRLFVKIYFHQKENEYRLFVLTSFGQIYSLSCINFMDLETACSEQQYTSVSEMVNKFEWESLYDGSRLNLEVSVVIQLLHSSYCSFILMGRDIRLWHDEYGVKDMCILPEGIALQKADILKNRNMVIGLCKDSRIIVVCLYTLTPLLIWDSVPVLDMTVVDTAATSDTENSVLILVKEESSYCIFLMGFPGFEMKFRLPVEPISFFVYQQCNIEDILYLEGFGDGKIDVIRVKAIVESQPEFRLQRILRRGKFEEAERFARTFKLDMQLVYKAQVQGYMQEFQPWNHSGGPVKEAFQQFIELLNKITDEEFVAECCVNTILPDFFMAHKLLNYGMTRLTALSDTSRKNIVQLIAQLNSTLVRLDTCQLVYGAAISVDHWLQFLKADLVQECHKYLKRGDMNEAVLIWNRHLGEIKPKLSVAEACSLLDDIPYLLYSKDVLKWLQHYISIVLELFPHLLTWLVNWTIEKAKSLEVTERVCWPECALDLTTGLLSLIHVPFTGPKPLTPNSITLHQEHCNPSSPLNQLLTFIKVLRNLQILKIKYEVVISCSDYMEESSQKMVNTILQLVPLKHIHSLMTGFLDNLMLEKELNSDIVISFFIQGVINNSVSWLFCDKAPWEDRLAELIPCIHDIQEQLECTLCILKESPVPWSQTITQLVENALKLNHPLTDMIRKEYKFISSKLIMKKYGISLKLYRTYTFMIQHILALDKEDSFSDALELAKCVMNNLNNHTDFVMIMEYYIEKGEPNKALEVLNGLETVIADKCKQFMTLKVQILLQHGNLESLGRYIALLTEISNVVITSRIKDLFDFQTEFKQNVYLSVDCRSQLREKVLDYCVKDMFQGLTSKQVTLNTVLNRISRLSQLLQISVEEGLAALVIKVAEIDFSMGLEIASGIEDLSKVEAVVHNKMATLIGVLLTHYKPDTHIDLSNNLANTVYSLARQLMTHCDSDDLTSAVYLYEWTRLFAVTDLIPNRTLTPLSANVYYDRYSSIVALQISHSILLDMITYYISCNTSSSERINCLVPLKNVNCELQYDELLTKLKTSIRNLREEQQDMLNIQILCNFFWLMCAFDNKQNEIEEIENIITQSIYHLLKKLVSCRHFDEELALILLNYFSSDEAVSWLNTTFESVGHNYQCLNSVSLLGIQYCRDYNINSRHFNKLRISCKWAKKLSELSLPYKEAFKQSESDQKQLLIKLINFPGIHLSLLRDFCLDMRFDFQECLQLYLEQTILSWEPDISIGINSATEKQEMTVKNSSTQLFQKCTNVIAMMDYDKAFIQRYLLDLWDQVNCYYYEVYVVIVKLLEEMLATTPNTMRNKMLLNFLMQYTRNSSPQQFELDSWFQMHPNTDGLPLIAKFRLPFTTLLCEDPWKIITPELNLSTYEKWFEVTGILALDKNTLCILTINRLKSEHLNGKKAKANEQEWCVHLRNKSLLSDIQKCVKNITNLEMASAALYFVVNHMTPGADQVAAAEMCYLQAQHWASQENTTNSKKGLTKVEKKYLMVATNHILYKHNLGHSEYLQLVLKPEELIHALYCDKSILTRCTGLADHSPDINGAVDAIGKLYDLDLNSIRLDLLGEWLQPDTPPLNASIEDTTVNIAAALYQKKCASSTLEDENIIRACYLLENKELFNKGIQYLVVHACIGSEDTVAHPVSMRLRALQCLYNVTNTTQLEEITGRDVHSIRSYMKSLFFTSELEKLGLSWSIGRFETSGKPLIIKALLQQGGPQSLYLAANLSKEYEVTSFWNEILEQMTELIMVEELTILLPYLSTYTYLLNSTTFRKAWNCVLMTPLVTAELPLTDEGRQKVEACLTLLSSCPIPSQIDVTSIYKQCVKLNAVDIAAKVQHFLINYGTAIPNGTI